MVATNLRKGGGGGGGCDSLAEDIIFDVLTRLPAKVLCRFRCVCKGWRELISDEAFIAAQKSRADPLIAGVFRTSSPCNVQKFELRVMDMDGSVLRVFKDVAGFPLPTRLDLICVYGLQGGATIIDPAADRRVSVDEHNPSTPMPLSMTRRHYSFGRAAPSGAYKILRIHKQGSQGQQLCDIATISDGCGAPPAWRQRLAPPFITDWYSAGCQATVNGVLYLLSSGKTTSDTPHQGWQRIASFNLESEEWTETIDGPAMRFGKDESSAIALAELKATLSMVQTVYCPPAYQDGRDHYTNIWLLIDSKKSIWVKQYTIQMPKNVLPVNKELDVLSDGRILLLNVKSKEHGFPYRYTLQFYNPSTEAFTDVMEMAEEFTGAMAFYTGSLLSWQITVDGLG